MKEKQNENTRPMQMLAWAILYLAVVILSGVALLWLAFGSPKAHAAAPAEIEVIGIPASKRAECSEAERFVFRVATLRDSGVPKNEVIGMMVGAHVVAQMQTDPQVLANRIEIIWIIEGTPAEISKAAFQMCMKGEMA